MQAKKMLDADVLDAQAAFELPERELMQQSGLVNVNLEDVALQLPIGVAANVCDVNANVLAADLQDDGTAECAADVTQEPTSEIN